MPVPRPSTATPSPDRVSDCVIYTGGWVTGRRLVVAVAVRPGAGRPLPGGPHARPGPLPVVLKGVLDGPVET